LKIARFSNRGGRRPDLSSLVALLYVSESSAPDATVIEAIRAESRRTNLRDDVTGLLLFDGRAFCQYAEGGGFAVADLLRRLQGDPRHRDMRVLHYDEVARRSFSEWRLGFAYVADPQAIERVSMRDRDSLSEALRDLVRESGASE